MANMKYQKQRIDGSDVIIPEPQHLDGTEYVNTGTSNPLPTKDESVEARLQAIEQTQSQILDKLNDTIDTRLTGSNMEYYVKTNNDMPSADSVPIGAFCMVVDTSEIYQSNGTDWKVF